MWQELVAQKIKEARKDRGLTQTEMAEQIGCDQSYISKLERSQAQYPPSPGFWAAFADHYGGDMNDLLWLITIRDRVSEKRALELLGKK